MYPYGQVVALVEKYISRSRRRMYSVGDDDIATRRMVPSKSEFPIRYRSNREFCATNNLLNLIRASDDLAHRVRDHVGYGIRDLCVV